MGKKKREDCNWRQREIKAKIKAALSRNGVVSIHTYVRTPHKYGYNVLTDAAENVRVTSRTGLRSNAKVVLLHA